MLCHLLHTRALYFHLDSSSLRLRNADACYAQPYCNIVLDAVG